MKLFNRVRELIAEHSDKEIGFKAIEGPGTAPLVESCFDEGTPDTSPTTYQAMLGDLELPYTFEHSQTKLDTLATMVDDPLENVAKAIAQAILCLIEPKKFMQPEEAVFGFMAILREIDGTKAATALSTRILRLREALLALQNDMSMEAYIMSHDLSGDFFTYMLKSQPEVDAEHYNKEHMRSYLLSVVFRIIEEEPEIGPEGIDGEKERICAAQRAFNGAMHSKLMEEVDDGRTGWDDPAFYEGTGDYVKTFQQRLSLSYSKLLDELQKDERDPEKLRHLFVKLANYCLFGYYHNQI